MKKIDKERDIFLFKRESRKVYSRALRCGLIKLGKECYFCNKNNNLCGHHSDYKKPLQFTTLCRNCHTKLHLLITKLKRANQKS